MPRFIEMSGKTFGELTVIRQGKNDKHQQATWICLCSCGKEHTVVGSCLRSGNTKSCGHRPTHCKVGHEYTEENTYIYRGVRLCITCRTDNRKLLWAEYKKKGIRSPSQTVESRRRSSLWYLGWTPELYEKVLKEQEEKCAICRKPTVLKGGAGASRSCADHEHVDPPKPRGILCGDCNTGLGKFRDNPDALRAAASYVEKFSLETPAEEVKHLTVSA